MASTSDFCKEVSGSIPNPAPPKIEVYVALDEQPRCRVSSKYSDDQLQGSKSKKNQFGPSPRPVWSQPPSSSIPAPAQFGPSPLSVRSQPSPSLVPAPAQFDPNPCVVRYQPRPSSVPAAAPVRSQPPPSSVPALPEKYLPPLSG